MKKIIYWFLFLFAIFLLNVAWYFFSENYRFLIKKIKHGDNYVVQDKNSIDDLNFTDDEIVKTNTWNCNCSTVWFSWDTSSGIFNSNTSTWLVDVNIPVTKTQTQELTSSWIQNWTWITSDETIAYSWIVNWVFEKFPWYDFKYKSYSDNYMMFWFTDEYAKKYLTYNAWKFEIYFYVEDNFDKVYDFFDVLSKELNFEVKKQDNFWNRSFYVNTTDAKFVKVVIKSWNKLFWLNIKKQYYNEVKNILKNF